jgi:hypothetical protein
VVLVRTDTDVVTLMFKPRRGEQWIEVGRAARAARLDATLAFRCVRMSAADTAAAWLTEVSRGSGAIAPSAKRLGGSANLLKPFPNKPLGWTDYRLSAKAMAAQERSFALERTICTAAIPGF